MQRTFYAFFTLMAIIGISNTAIESAKNTAYGSQRAQRSGPIHDRDWEFVRFEGDQEIFADLGGDPTDQRLGAHPIEVDVAINVSPDAATISSSGFSEPIDYAALDAAADPITGEKYGCGLGQPIEPVANSVVAAESVKATNPWEHVCPVGLPSNYNESGALDAEVVESDLAQFPENDPHLDWDCGEYVRDLTANANQASKGWPAPEDSMAANESTPAADYTLSNRAKSDESPESPRVPLVAEPLQDSFRFECPEFVLEYLRQFSTAMHELENYAPAHVDAKSSIAEEYAAAENAAALAELRQATETVAAKPALPSLPINQCDRSGLAYNELGYPSCGGYSPNWQQEEASLSLATESNLASTMTIESVDPLVDAADDRWIGPEANLPETDLIHKVDGPLPALPCELEIGDPEDSNSLANLMRLIVTLDPNLKLQDSDSALENNPRSQTIVENGLWSGRDFDFPGCDDIGEPGAGEPIVTQNGWTKEALALDDLRSDDSSAEAGPYARLELDPIVAWLGEAFRTAWNWGNETLASFHRHSDEVSSARPTWLETR